MALKDFVAHMKNMEDLGRASATLQKEDDPEKRKPDISLAKAKLKWEPKIELDEGLKKTVAYFKEVLK